jgi:hypothetical protein
MRVQIIRCRASNPVPLTTAAEEKIEIVTKAAVYTGNVLDSKRLNFGKKNITL